ncbi:MAG: LPS assembly protein LptD [Thalassotalea sp.]
MPFSFLLSKRITLLALICSSLPNLLFAQEKANTAFVCPIQQINKISPPAALLLAGKGMAISSQKTFLEKNQIARFSGNVTMASKNQSIQADFLEFNRKTTSMTAKGEIQFQTNSINVFANYLSSNKQSNSTSLNNASYQLASNPGHGSAGIINVDNNGTLSLIDSDFTTCFGETPDWQLKASEINISMKENIGEAYHARLHIFDVPVFYIPYFNFPVTNQRKSGFLYPSISSSSRLGATIETPFYWNIADNMDATIAPKYMSKRGTQLLSEFRYLTGQQSGEIHFEYLNKDDKYHNEDARYLTRFQHTGTFSNNFRAHLDTTTISDDSYLVDIGSEHYNSNDAYLYQTGELSYFSDSWALTARVQDFEILGNHLSSYKTVPQLEINKQIPLNLFNGRFELYSELSRFENDNINLPTAERYHVEAGVIFPISTPAWFLNSEFKLLQTNYQQKNLSDDSLLAKEVDRTLPKVRFHGGINFDRTMSTPGYTQTLEPQLQYLYIPNKDQSSIGLYDSAPLQDDFSGLFRDKRYSGLDRIAEANQYSWGVTSRILDPSNDEIFRFSLGRIVYLNDSNYLTADDLNQTEDQSALAAESFFQLNHQWQVSGNIQYNTESDITNNSQLNIDYQHNNFINSQLNHRYIRNVSGVSLEQLSLLTNVTINDKWQFVGRVTQDLQQKRSIESYTGLQYESCCWAVRFAYHRHINSSVDDINLNNNMLGEFESSFMIQFVIKGLNGQNTRLDSGEMLNNSIFGYKRPYFLNN